MPFSFGTPFTLNFAGFTGAGFAPSPTAGQLDSDDFLLVGFSDAYSGYGATATTANTDYTRGSINGTNPATAGVYAAVTGVTALGTSFVVQPNGSEFGPTPGTITVRVQYTGVGALTGFTFAYDGVYRNNEDRSSTATVQYAVQTAASEPASYSSFGTPIGFTTPTTQAASPVWTQVSFAAQTVTTTINQNDYVFIRFTIGDAAGTGSRDEIGFDNFVLTAICLLRGTGIMTPGGERPVESLRIGDAVMTRSGPRPVKWVGRQAFISRFLRGDPGQHPVRIMPGALGEGRPDRPLFVSQDHALLIDGVLVPAGLVVNGGSIAITPPPDVLEWYNVELEEHGCVLAQGVWAESYADTGNRRAFHNHAEFAALYPGHAPRLDRFCAPRLLAGDPALAPIRARLGCDAAERSTVEPGFHIEVGGMPAFPVSVQDGAYRFVAPRSGGAVRLRSRSDVPGRGGAGGADCRRLGVAVRRVSLDGQMALDLASPRFGPGFHPPEGAHRWTDGDALLRLPVRGGAVLEIEVEAMPSYRLAYSHAVRAAA